MATDFENSVGFDTAWANYTDPFDSQTYDPAGPLNSDFMNCVFGHILDWTPQERAPHLQWWTNQLDTSAWTRGQVLSYFSDYADARSNPNIGGTDATTPPPAATNNGNTDVAQDLTYLIDVEGIVVRVHDTSAGIDQYACYGYNTRYELTSAYTRGDGSCAGSDSTGPDPYSVTYAYNSQGNITSATGTNTPGGSYTYGAGTAGPHAVTAAGTRTFGYDNAGNMTSRTTHTGGNQALTYTLQKRLKTITGAGTTMTVLYDAEGNRVKRTLNGTTTYSLGETYETDGTTATIHHRLGKHIGTTIGTAFTAVATDHLGSPTLTRDTAGTTTTTRFQPYGQTRGQTTPTLTGQPFDLTFTGQTNDPGTGLYDYNARHYDPTLARFAMADPILDNTNRYTYTRNNPVNAIDPTGNEECRTVKLVSTCWSEADRVPIPGRGPIEANDHAGKTGEQYCPFICAIVYVTGGSVYWPAEGWTLSDGIDDGLNDILYDATMLWLIEPAADLGYTCSTSATGCTVAMVLAAGTRGRGSGPRRGGRAPNGLPGGAKPFFDDHGRLTNGTYTIDAPGMAKHKTGDLSSGNSQFGFGVDAETLTLDAASFADANKLWVAANNSAKVPVTNGVVGALGRTGEPTSWINVYRTKTGFVHGSPGGPP